LGEPPDTGNEASSVHPDPATRARDHLANERTYLAWVRTALTLMALGLAVASFAGKVRVSSAVAGGLLVVVGGAGVWLGARRYAAVTRELDSGTYRVGTRGNQAIMASAVLVIAVVVALVVLLVGRS
jgi:inner membrane protein YidH